MTELQTFLTGLGTCLTSLLSFFGTVTSAFLTNPVFIIITSMSILSFIVYFVSNLIGKLNANKKGE